MPKVTSSLAMKADGKKIFAIVKNMAGYPAFMKDVVSVDILEEGTNYDISHWVTNADGRRIVWAERDDFYPEELKITYSQTEGDLKRMNGFWTIEPQGEECLVTLEVDFEFGIPMIAGLLNPILKKKVRENSENMLAAIKEQIEA